MADERRGSIALAVTGASGAIYAVRTLADLLSRGLVVGAIEQDLILPLVTKLGPQNLVHDVTVVRQENEPGRIFIEPADRKDSFWVADLMDNIAVNVGFARRGDPHGLVVLDVDPSLPPRNHLPVPRDHVPPADLISELCDDVVDGDAPGFDETVGFSPRANAVLGEEFIDANGVGH